MKVFIENGIILNALQTLQTLPNLKCSQIINALNALINQEEDRFILQVSKDLHINFTSIKLSENPGFFTITILKPNGKEVREEIKIGKLIQQLLTIKFKPDELEDFTNNVKFFQFGDDPTFRLVEGEEIVYYYHPGNMVEEGELGNSCMSSAYTQEFLKFYARNNKIKLFLKTNEENKTVARALLWETDKGLYLDRRYAINNDLKLAILKEAQKRFKLYDYFRGKCNPHLDAKVEVSFINRSNAMNLYYPFMDTFKYLVIYHDKSILYANKKAAFAERDNAYDIYTLNRTDGEYEDRYGCDRYGYDENGYDRDGYDRDGFDVWGFDREGYDKYGFDILGYDREGFHRNGYNREGFDRNGFDKDGFDRNGFDRNGYDRNGRMATILLQDKIFVWKKYICIH